MNQEARLIELEIRYTHQQRTIDELNEVVIAQGRAIERLTAEVAFLRGRIAALPDERQTREEPPPHY